MQRRWLAWSRDESGSVAVITAICLTFLIGFVALVVDIGHLYSVRNELQNAADAASLAGARALFPTKGYPDATLIPLTEPPFCDLAVGAGRAAAASNQAGGTTNLTTVTDDVQTGIWDWDAKTFTPDATPSYNINAVRSTVRRDSVANQPVASWFAQIFGIDSTAVNAQSVAAVGYVKKPNGSFLPIWVPTHIWDDWKENSDQSIKACPDPSDTFAWAAPVPESANAQYLKDAVNGVDGIPMPSVDNTVNLSNGQLGAVQHAIQQQITAAQNTYPSGYINETTGQTITYTDGTPVTGWLTYMLVGDFINPNSPDKMNQGADVDAFVPVIVTDIVHTKNDGETNPQWQINFFLLPGTFNFVLPGATPGGPVSQIFATQPVLVK
jgi:Flp pilus assembly protein TadG